MRSDADRLRASVPISQVVGQRIPLERRGHEWAACCPFHADRTPSLFVCDKKGVFNCFGCQAAGDVFEFVMRFDGVGFPAAVAAVDNGQFCQSGRTRPLEEPPTDTVEIARNWWAKSTSIIGTPAERYLEARGLPLVALPSDLPLRFARLRYRGGAEMHPTLVAKVTDSDGQFRGIQRTYLTEQGRKLDVDDPKLSLGSIGGNAIHIGGQAEEMIVCEGLEDGLSLAIHLPRIPVWVATGADNMAKIRLPGDCKLVTIAADNDDPGERSAAAASAAFSQQGKRTRIIRPTQGVKDFNQQILGHKS